MAVLLLSGSFGLWSPQLVLTASAEATTPAVVATPKPGGCLGIISEDPSKVPACGIAKAKPQKIPQPKGVGPHSGSATPFRKPGQPRTVGTPPALRPLAARRPLAAQPPRGQLQGNGRVIRSSFQRLSATRGEWRGAVTGAGNARVMLELAKNGAPFERRSIGSIELDDSAIPFVFRSPIPEAPGWDWRIVLR